MKKFNKRGFTIVELVIVIAVIGILAGVLIPTFSSITQRAQQTAAMQEATSGRDALLALTSGSMPEDTYFFVGDHDETTNVLDTKFVFKYSAGAMVAEDESDSRTIQQYDSKTLNTTYGFTGYHAMYVSDEVIANDIFKDYRANLVEIVGLTDPTGTVDTDSSAGDYILLICKDSAGTVKGLIRVYWTSDINPTMIIALGNVR